MCMMCVYHMNAVMCMICMRIWPKKKSLSPKLYDENSDVLQYTLACACFFSTQRVRTCFNIHLTLFFICFFFYTERADMLQYTPGERQPGHAERRQFFFKSTSCGAYIVNRHWYWLSKQKHFCFCERVYQGALALSFQNFCQRKRP
jgi:hypothetical protein